jgi:hypothetical protein
MRTQLLSSFQPGSGYPASTDSEAEEPVRRRSQKID